jgi:hypothetical protein
MRKAVVIDLRNNAYDRLVVEVHDPQELLNASWNK